MLRPRASKDGAREVHLTDPVRNYADITSIGADSREEHVTWL